jgi:hypothetical protein
MGVTRDPAALIERDLLMVELDLRGVPRARCVAGRENITGRMRRNGLFYKTLRDQKRG